MAGKGAPPLFDLIRTGDKAAPPPGFRPAPGPSRPTPAEQGVAAPAAAPKAAPAPEPKPEPRPRPSPAERVEESRPQAEAVAEPPRSENPPAGEGGPQIDVKGKFSVPVSALYIAVPLILVGILIAYSWGFSAGGKDRDEQLKPYLQPEDVVDPLVAGGGTEAPGGASGPAVRPVVPPPPETRQAPAPARRPAGSPVTRDTREPEHNYLLIARMDGERAIKAAMALTERGLPTIAVETGGARSNNWRLYSLLGIPSEKFRQEWQLRSDHKTKVEAVCRDLGADAGGPIDASTAYWEKYAP